LQSTDVEALEKMFKNDFPKEPIAGLAAIGRSLIIPMMEDVEKACKALRGLTDMRAQVTSALQECAKKWAERVSRLEERRKERPGFSFLSGGLHNQVQKT
jgi:hypothetical protein